MKTIARVITEQVPNQATNGPDRTSFVIQMTYKRPRNGPDPATNGHTKLKIRGTGTQTRAKRPLFNDLLVPQTTWDSLGTAWDKGRTEEEEKRRRGDERRETRDLTLSVVLMLRALCVLCGENGFPQRRKVAKEIKRRENGIEFV